MQNIRKKKLNEVEKKGNARQVINDYLIDPIPTGRRKLYVLECIGVY